MQKRVKLHNLETLKTLKEWDPIRGMYHRIFPHNIEPFCGSWVTIDKDYGTCFSIKEGIWLLPWESIDEG